jgi:hypothetical protein
MRRHLATALVAFDSITGTLETKDIRRHPNPTAGIVAAANLEFQNQQRQLACPQTGRPLRVQGIRRQLGQTFSAQWSGETMGQESSRSATHRLPAVGDKGQRSRRSVIGNQSGNGPDQRGPGVEHPFVKTNHRSSVESDGSPPLQSRGSGAAR